MALSTRFFSDLLERSLNEGFPILLHVDPSDVLSCQMTIVLSIFTDHVLVATYERSGRLECLQVIDQADIVRVSHGGAFYEATLEAMSYHPPTVGLDLRFKDLDSCLEYLKTRSEAVALVSRQDDVTRGFLIGYGEDYFALNNYSPSAKFQGEEVVARSDIRAIEFQSADLQTLARLVRR